MRDHIGLAYRQLHHLVGMHVEDFCQMQRTATRLLLSRNLQRLLNDGLRSCASKNLVRVAAGVQNNRRSRSENTLSVLKQSPEGNTAIALSRDIHTRPTSANSFKHIGQVAIYSAQIVKNEEHPALFRLALAHLVCEIFDKVARQARNEAGKGQAIQAGVGGLHILICTSPSKLSMQSAPH